MQSLGCIILEVNIENQILNFCVGVWVDRYNLLTCNFSKRRRTSHAHTCEVWILDDNEDTINMKIAEPKLANYSWYPELFIVDSDFCIKK